MKSAHAYVFVVSLFYLFEANRFWRNKNHNLLIKLKRDKNCGRVQLAADSSQWRLVDILNEKILNQISGWWYSKNDLKFRNWHL